MTNLSLAGLSQDELLQLALTSSAADDSAAAILYLKESTSRTDASGIAHYLLGAQYAQIKLYQRAVDEMEAALRLEPGLAIARLQLGLLWLTSGAVDNGRAVLEPLRMLPSSDPMHLFGEGLLHLINDQFQAARDCLRDGVAGNMTNPALNVDMQKIIERIGLGLESGPAVPEVDASAGPDDSEINHGRHILLSAYTGNTEH